MKPPSLIDLLTIAHLIGVVVGMGSALVTDTLFFKTIKTKIFDKTHLDIIHTTSNLVWLGCLITILSGIGLFFQAADYYLANPQFWVKMIIVTIILANGATFHFYHLPLLKKLTNKRVGEICNFKHRRELLLASGAISSTSWFTTLFLGSTLARSWPLVPLLLIYLGIISTAILTALFLRNFIIPSKE